MSINCQICSNRLSELLHCILYAFSCSLILSVYPFIFVRPQVDQNNDGNIDFGEFLSALWKVKNGDTSGFANMVKKQVELIAIKTASGGVKSYSQDEVTAFANHLNYCLGDDPKLKYLMPINPENLDLMKKVADGVMISRFINMIEPDTIDFRAVNYKKKGGLNQYHIIENQNLNIAAAKSIGIRYTL